jgi:hypothetical protein
VTTPSAEPLDAGDVAPSTSADEWTPRVRARVWTRQLHNYLGLSLLLFLWFFSFSGLVLNHPGWKSAQFWAERAESVVVRPIAVPSATSDVAIASALMGQLGIVGELHEIRRAGDGARFQFQIVKPGRVYRVEARFDSTFARVTTIRLNAWGVADALHKFTGVRIGDPRETRDWLLTKMWSLAMDAVALGIVVLVMSGLYLWYRLPSKRLTGLVALGLGVAACMFFLYGLGALFA